MSIYDFDQAFGHIVAKQSSDITSNDLQSMLNCVKTSYNMSKVINAFAKHGTTQDIDSLLACYDVRDVLIDDSTILSVLMCSICEKGSQDLLEYMVFLGFEPCKGCLVVAALERNDTMVDYLLSTNCKISKHVLGYVDDLNIATKLILHGAKVNIKHKYTQPLYNCIVRNNIEVALLLISMNAEVNEDIVKLALENGNSQLIEAVQSRVQINV